MVATLIATPDPNWEWWTPVFSPDEYDKMNARFQQIINEHNQEQAIPNPLIELTIELRRNDIVPTLKALGADYGERPANQIVIDKLVEALAFEYFANKAIEPDDECNRIYAKVNKEPEDEDDWFA